MRVSMTGPLRMFLLLSLLLSCAARYPGPVGWVGRTPEPITWQRPASPEVVPASVVSRPPAEPLPIPEPEPERDLALGAAIGDAARHYLRHRPQGFRDDCSGFAMASLNRAGAPVSGNTARLWELAREAHAIHHRKRPRVGDLAFFDNTYDRNRNGRWDDELTHIAVVIEVGDDGTIVLGNAGTSKGRSELIMNLQHRSEHLVDGEVVNDYLRRPSGGDRSRYLASSLWRAFATLHHDDLETWSQ